MSIFSANIKQIARRITRRGNPSTSMDAAMMVAPKLNANLRRLDAAYLLAGKIGLTQSEAHNKLAGANTAHSTIRARVSTLEKDGILVRTGERRTAGRGPEFVYVHIKHWEGAVPERKKNRVERISEAAAALLNAIDQLCEDLDEQLFEELRGNLRREL